MFNAPARRVTASQHVTDIYIRHYQGILVHVCELLKSPLIQSLRSAVPAAQIVAESSIYVAFAACAKFKLFFNGKLVLQSIGVFAPTQPHYKLYGTHVPVSAAGIFSISLESCSDSKGFIGCIGPSVCTGMNDDNGWWCTRNQPPEGWMLPTYQIEGVENFHKSSTKICNISHENDVWSSFVKERTDEQCFGLSPYPGATDIISCSLACCSDDACDMFQWCSGGDCVGTTDTTGSRCWIGKCSGQKAMSGWVSGTRTLTESVKLGGWMLAQSQGKVTSKAKWVESGLDVDALWLWPNEVQNDEVHCRWAI